MEHVIGLTEGGDNSQQQTDAHRPYTCEDLAHAAALLKFLKEYGRGGGEGEGGHEHPQIGSDGAGDRCCVDAGEGGAVEAQGARSHLRNSYDIGNFA